MKIANTVKRKAFQIEDKIKIMKLIEDGTNQSALCKEFFMKKSSASNI